MIYRITPADAAVVLVRADLPLTKERELIATLWKDHRRVERRYQVDESLFARAIRREMLKQERTRDAEDQALLAGEGDALEVAVRQGGGDPVLRYFQLIRLELLHVPGRVQRVMKLRTLLRDLGYKKRSPQLVKRINRALRQTRLQTLTRGQIPTRIEDAGLDTMIIFRLRPRRWHSIRQLP